MMGHAQCLAQCLVSVIRSGTKRMSDLGILR